jgi:hypothetical protein
LDNFVFERLHAAVPPTAPDSQPLPPPSATPVGSTAVVTGAPIAPIDRIRIFSPAEWEDFVLEWADSLREQYAEVGGLGGAGDQGRDVIGLYADGDWDNYQCKHYDHALVPGDVWTEIGKVLYYTYTDAFSPPKRYYFVAPRGVGTKLSNLLRSPDRLREELLANWDKHCATKITATADIALSEDLRRHIDAFDFGCFSSISPHRLIDGHAKTRWYSARFGGGLPPRPDPELPPAQPAAHEAPYVRALLDAYADHLKRPVADVQDLPAASQLAGHFDDARREFYSAEALRAFSRDTLPTGSYEELQDQMHSGVRDDLRDEHDDGYLRLRAVVGTARSIALDGHALNTSLTPRDRGGICHQLANDGTIPKWTR